MSWFKKKVCPWDDNFDLYFWSSEDLYTEPYWDWPIPDNLYLEITQIQCGVGFALIGFGVKHSPLIRCMRGDICRWHTPFYATSLSNIGMYVTWSQGIDINQAAVGTYYSKAVLPTPCYMLPGEYLRFEWENKQANDYYRYPRITAKSWKIY